MHQEPSGIQIAFLGGGNMAEALIRGLLSQRLYSPGAIAVSDIAAARVAYLRDEFGVGAVTSNAEVAAAAPIVVLAVKPQHARAVLSEVRSQLTGKLAISIVAGLTLKALTDVVPEARWVRAMPNTPALVQAGMTVVCPAAGIGPADRKHALDIFRAVGRAVEIEQETLLDAVTGLSGSGPAYVFLFLEALADGGVQAGLPRGLAMELAIQTVLGSAKLAQETARHPGELKDQVASPGGTTIAGIAALERAAFRSAVMQAVDAATARAKELGSS